MLFPESVITGDEENFKENLLLSLVFEEIACEIATKS